MKTKYIAHRGGGQALFSVENTVEAFERAAKSAVSGIETDVHITKDGKFVVFHDDSTLRLCGQESIIENTAFSELQKLKIFEKHKIPTLNEYLDICKSGSKDAVIELKNPFAESDIKKLIGEVEKANYLSKSIFISFDMNNCLTLRENLPNQPIQFVTLTYEEKVLKQIAKQKIDLDIEYTCLSKDRINFCHDLGIKVNCWTLGDFKIAQHFENCKIDYITSNNLDGTNK